MPVRIFFRGLVLFRFPKAEPNANKLVAELISEPPNRKHADKVPQGQDDHAAEIQVITGEDVHQLLPQGLNYKAQIDIKIPGCVGGVRRLPSFDAHVPKLSRLATMTNPPLERGPEDDSYVRNTVTVDCGAIRVGDIVLWDASGFPLTGNVGDIPATAVEVKFMGVGVSGHAANECVIEIPDTDVVDIECPDHPQLDGLYRSTRRRNQRVQASTTDILIRNYEYQREKPVPWGLDFQWLFARLGYRPVDLAGTELDDFVAEATEYDERLFRDDRTSLLPDTMGYPFPYIPTSQPLGRGLVKLHPLAKPGTDIYSRPVCVPGDE